MMTDEQKPIEKLYQVLSLTLHSDGTSTLTLDADVEGVRQVVHMPGVAIISEIEQLMQENMALKAQVEQMSDFYPFDPQAESEKTEHLEEEEHADSDDDNPA